MKKIVIHSKRGSSGEIPKENLSSSKCESREEAKEDREEQEVIENGRWFQRRLQEGRKEDRWEELESRMEPLEN